MANLDWGAENPGLRCDGKELDTLRKSEMRRAAAQRRQLKRMLIELRRDGEYWRAPSGSDPRTHPPGRQSLPPNPIAKQERPCKNS